LHTFCLPCIEQVLDIVGANPGGSELLNRNIIGGNGLLSSLVQEDAADVNQQSSSIYQVESLKLHIFVLHIGRHSI
jgi:hypothetical protein